MRNAIGALTLLQFAFAGMCYAQVPSLSPRGEFIEDASGCKVWNVNPVPNETIVWAGACKEGYAEGNGVLNWFRDGQPNGTTSGTFYQGKVMGRGVASAANGARYEGDFVDSVQTGRAVITTPSGMRYEGTVLSGKFHGYGRQNLPSGDRYEGQFRDGQRHGTGRYSWNNGASYEGDFEAGKMHGRGIFTTPDGKKQQVAFVEGKRVPSGGDAAVAPSVPAAQAGGDASSRAFIGSYGPTKSPVFASLQDELRRDRMLEKLAVGLSAAITLPRPVTLGTAECGVKNALYQPQYRRVVLCLELVVQMGQGIRQSFAGRLPEQKLQEAYTGAIAFIVMHEIGHALIHVLDLPVLGREEDAADQISTFFLLNGGDPAPEALIGALWFFRPNALVYTRQHFSDEHSVNPQRQSNIACWALGKDPARYGFLLRSGVLTPQRAARCRGEYARLDATVRKLLGNNIRLP